MKNPVQLEAHMQGNSVLRAAINAGVIAGLVDVGAASLINAASPTVILRAISSGVLGMAAYSGAASIVILGLALQVFMSVVIAGIFALASLRLSWLTARPIAAGSLFGVGVFIVMNFIVVPMSAFGPKPTHPTWEWLLLNVLAMLLFGVIVAIVVRWTLEAQHTAGRRPS
jgi:hypothetical protein